MIYYAMLLPNINIKHADALNGFPRVTTSWIDGAHGCGSCRGTKLKLCTFCSWFHFICQIYVKLTETMH